MGGVARFEHIKAVGCVKSDCAGAETSLQQQQTIWPFKQVVMYCAVQDKDAANTDLRANAPVRQKATAAPE